MARNPFKNSVQQEQPNRNIFDLSFRNNLTLKFGALYPVMCQEVIPGDSFEIDAAFGLRFLPMTFPVQTPMHANLHFFYVRNRNLWKDWRSFIGATKSGLVPPYIDLSSSLAKEKYLKTSSLGDYLGLPTTVVTSAHGNQYLSFTTSFQNVDNLNQFASGFFTSPTCYFKDNKLQFLTLNIPLHRATSVYQRYSVSEIFNQVPLNSLDESMYFGGFTVSYFSTFLTEKSKLVLGSSTDIDKILFPFIISCQGEFNSNSDFYFLNGSFSVSGKRTELIFTQDDVSKINDLIKKGNRILFGYYFVHQNNPPSMPSTYPLIDGSRIQDLDTAGFDELINSKIATEFGNSTKISALPFRAYESIYNGFYRNQINDPFKIDGVPEYDVFIPTDAGGSDSTIYDLHYRNWEDDVLNTAMPSPQQGLAPLLGMTTNINNDFDVAHTYQIRFTSVDDNSKNNYIQVKQSTDGSLAFALPNQNVDENLQGALEILNNARDFGISINDLRSVNSLQRWLEKNVARGYKYKDQMLSHFGVDLTLEECNMPEFIGGISQTVNVNQVTQTSPSSSDDNVLGSYAGNAYAIGSGDNKIYRYCDEHGFIIAILSVTPIPVYTQLLPKFFTKRSHLDYYSPEFSHIGLQPIKYENAFPLQALANNESLQDVFGYQRAWYEYLSNTDEAHGLFRTSLSNFLISREYSGLPRLSGDFLRIDPAVVNEIFAVTDAGEDKILGQVIFNITAKRPIPLFNEPRIE